jgi:hypothetical protein
MKIFNKTKGEGIAIRDSIRQKGETIKKRICDYLNRVTRGWSRRTITLYWLLFILIGVGISLDIGIRAIGHKASFEFQKAKHIVVALPRIIKPDNRDGLDQLLLKIKGYRHYLDSLSEFDGDKYKEFLRINPHIRDSLDVLESLLTKNVK